MGGEGEGCEGGKGRRRRGGEGGGKTFVTDIEVQIDVEEVESAKEKAEGR